MGSLGPNGLLEAKALPPGQSRQGRVVLEVREKQSASDTILVAREYNLGKLLVSPREAWEVRLLGPDGAAWYEGA